MLVNPVKTSVASVNENFTVFVGGLILSATEEDLWDYFCFFGPIRSIDLPMGKNMQKKGFAFVHFLDFDSASRALNQTVHSILGKRVALRRGLDPEEASANTKKMQERKLFVSGFNKEADETSVFLLFRRYGKVTRILSPKGGIGERGFCYVVMADKSSYDHLVEIGQICLLDEIISIQPATAKSVLRGNCKNASVYSRPNKSVEEMIMDHDYSSPFHEQIGRRHYSDPYHDYNKLTKGNYPICEKNSQLVGPQLNSKVIHTDNNHCPQKKNPTPIFLSFKQHLKYLKSNTENSMFGKPTTNGVPSTMDSL